VRMLAEITTYKDQMLRFMPGRRARDKERVFFVVFPR